MKTTLLIIEVGHTSKQFKCDMILNNLCECFNCQIVEGKTKGIIIMNKMIRKQLIIRIKKIKIKIKIQKEMPCKDVQCTIIGFLEC